MRCGIAVPILRLRFTQNKMGTSLLVA